MDYNARMYSPELGRFIQPDTIVPDISDLQSFNRYYYVNNNPLRFTDSNGHCIDGVSTIVCIAVAGAVIGAVADAIIQYNETGSINVGEVLTAAMGGAVLAVSLAIAAPAVIGMACEALMGLGALTGSTTIFGAGVATSETGTVIAGVVFGTGTLAKQLSPPSSPQPKVPNPDGQKGKPDHQAAVQDLLEKAKDEYPPGEGYKIKSSISIKDQLNGADRRPDVSAWDKDNKLMKVYEAARTNMDGSLVAREAAKELQYIKNGIDHFFTKITR
jgi:hypothetical protein